MTDLTTGALQDRLPQLKKCKLARYKLRFCSYLTHIMCMISIHVVQNMNSLSPMNNRLEALIL